MRTEYEQLSSRIVKDETKQKKSLDSLTLEVSQSVIESVIESVSLSVSQCISRLQQSQI
jgi:hypothetical protein